MECGLVVSLFGALLYEILILCLSVQFATHCLFKLKNAFTNIDIYKNKTVCIEISLFCIQEAVKNGLSRQVMSIHKPSQVASIAKIHI